MNKNNMPKRDFTVEELRFYDGVQSDGRILIALLGQVYDVSSAANFYGPTGAYGVFAGRDASRALGVFSVDASNIKDTYDDLSDLTPSQMDKAKQWEKKFKGFYFSSFYCDIFQ